MRRARASRPTVRLAVVLMAALALTGCRTGQADDAGPGGPGEPGDADASTTGSPDDPVSSDDPPGPGDDTPAPGEPASPVAADLVVVVDATGEGATTTWTLTCEPVGGDHPDAAAACAALASAGGAAAFAPTPRNVACTEQWGGPQTATVTGTVGGESVDAVFDRHNGCEISRWEKLAALFGDAGGGL